MKEQAIQKINKIGKISSVFALIGKILVGIAIGGLLITIIALLVIPKEFMAVTTSANTRVELDLESMGASISDEELPEAQATIAEAIANDMSEENNTDEYVTDITITNDKVEVGAVTGEYTITLHDVAWMCMAVLVYVVMTMVTLCFISSLCKAFRDCQTPFEENVIKKMQNFAYSLIPWAIISSVADSVSNSIMGHKVAINLSVDLGVVLIVLVVFLIVHIFKYGAVLQQESDETL